MELTEKLQEMRNEINRVFVGKEEVVDDVLICLMAGGHVLLEDIPGVGKTTLAKTLASTAGCSMGRIQFTTDTLPGDIIGVSVYNMKTGEFEYREGAVMHQILLADEINRTSPKTQASLLEAMAEGQVTVDGTRHLLPAPFMVIATQNPMEYLGTYPLPEAQMDRFMMRLTIGYPDREQEVNMAAMYLNGDTPDTARSILQSEEILALRRQVADVMVKENVLEYIENIILMTREEKSFILGASPRALLALVKASQAKAFLSKRNYVKPDDVKAVAAKVLLHRMNLTPEARMAGAQAEGIFKSLLLRVKIPVS